MITKQELKKLKDLAGEATPSGRTWVDFDGMNLIASSGKIVLNTVNNVHVDDMKFIAAANPETVLRLIEALEVATNYLQAASSEDFCLCGDTRGRAKTGLRKIYGPT